MWREVVAEHPGIPLPLLSRLISRNARMTDDRSSRKRAVGHMETVRLLKALSRLSLSSQRLRRQQEANLLFQDQHPWMPSEALNVPLNRFFLEPLERGDRPS